MPGFSSSGDDEIVHTSHEPSDHHVAQHKLRKQLEKITDDSLHEGMPCTSEVCFLLFMASNKDISLKVRGRLYSSCVRSGMLHGSETRLAP